MQRSATRERFAADVKCYHCGHISGQVIAYRREPIRLSNFVPRVGYSGPELKAGDRILCERCGGPVFLEDTGSLALVKGSEEYIALKRAAARNRAQAA